MVENGHDRLDTRATLGELGADSVPKPVRSYCRLAIGIDESGSRASGFERVLEQVPATDRLTAVNEHPVYAATYPAIVVRGGGSRLSVLDPDTGIVAGRGPLVTLPAQKRAHLSLDRSLQQQPRTEPGHLLNRTRQILAAGEHLIDLRAWPLGRR